MIYVRHSADRGLADLGWLHSQHSFSFPDYHDPKQMGFGQLRVINKDQIKPNRGFDTHGHRDMEILSYILQAEVEHKDDMGNGPILRPGEIQRMSAGTGIRHSESNPSSVRSNHFFQIWIKPDRYGIQPGYEQIKIPKGSREGKLSLIGSPDGRGHSVTIHQDIELYSCIMASQDTVAHDIIKGRCVWIQLASGAIEVNNVSLSVGDGAAVISEPFIDITAMANSEFLLFDLCQ